MRYLLDRADCGVAGASDAYNSILKVLNDSDFRNVPEESKIIIFALAYTSYSREKKGNIKAVMDDTSKDTKVKQSEIRDAWKHISGRNALKRNCDEANDFLESVLKEIGGKIENKIREEVANEVKTISDKSRKIAEDVALNKTTIENELKSWKEDQRRSKRVSEIWKKEMGLFKIGVTKPIERFSSSVIIFLFGLALISLIKWLFPELIAWSVDGLKAVAEWLKR